MKQIFRKFTLAWWQFGVLKISLISLGIILGATLWNRLSDLMPLWWLLFIGGAIYISYVCLRQKEE